MSQAPPLHVLDTSALFTLIEDEAGVEQVLELLEKAKRGEVILLISFMSFMEVYYISLQERGAAEAQERVRLLEALPILRVESSKTLGVRAGALKAAHRLSVADAWIAALAQERDATLVHKDPEFEQVEATVKTIKLPYKESTS